jgi:hypothetical protein
MNNTVAHYVSKDPDDYLDCYQAEVHFIDGQQLTPTSFGESGDYGEWKPIEYSGTYGTNGFYLPMNQDYTVEGFSATTYTGTGATQYIGGVGFQPDLVWLKRRQDAQNHALFDSVRGANKRLVSNGTEAEGAVSNWLNSFDTDGFTLGTNTSNNYNARTQVAWCWDMGGSTVSNTDGDITSSVRANTTYGQSIVSWVGTDGADSVGHGLDSAPELLILKNRSRLSTWRVHDNISGKTNGRMDLNGTGAENTANHQITFQSTTFTFNTDSGAHEDWNQLNENIIAYCFHSVTGYSKIGSYLGDSTTDGSHTVNVGFTPAFVMVKCINDTESWNIWDNARNIGIPSGTNNRLAANSSAAEVTNIATGADYIEFTSTGWKFLGLGGGANSNAASQEYIYMAFADKREAAFWLDASGNNNDWTPNNLTESDVSKDSPTNNFCTLNPLSDSSATLSQGNLQNQYGGGNYYCPATFQLPKTGKWYWEVHITALHSNGNLYGRLGITYEDSNSRTINDGYGYGVYASGLHMLTSTGVYSTGLTDNVGDIIQFAVDMDNGKFYIGQDDTYYNTSSPYGDGNPSAGTNPSATGIDTTLDWRPDFNVGHDSTYGTKFHANFGQDSSFAGNKTAQGNQDGNSIGDFYYTPPTDFLALCTSNLPAVAVVPSEHFNTITYTGNASDSSTTQEITTDIQPDFVWMKCRSDITPNRLQDIVRGVNSSLYSDTTGAETDATGSDITTFGTTSFTLTGDGAGTNRSGRTYVAWNWKANGSGSANTVGTINSTVSVNTDAGFSIVEFTSTSAGTVGHGLSSAPEMVIVRGYSGVSNWHVFHEDVGVHYDLHLNGTDAKYLGTDHFYNPVSSSVFGFGDWMTSSGTGIAYCFHSVDGYSKVGSYTGNGSADGTFVYTGFRPAYVMIKRTNTACNWSILDVKRNPYNALDNYLEADGSGAEAVAQHCDFVSNGIKFNGTGGCFNGNGDSYIFLAFAEQPFKHSNAR